MNAIIVAVGSEMLTPTRLDTNSLFLTQELNGLGIEVVEKCVVGDDRTRMTTAIERALANARLVIVTGGLGPTEDDVTRDAVAAALGVTQSVDEEVLTWIAGLFARMGRTMAENNKRQAMILQGAEILYNQRGTAPGQFIQTRDNVVLLLPGPPRELKPMFSEAALPKLRAMLPPMSIATRWYRVAGMGESDLDSLIAPVYTKYENPVTTILAKPGDVEIHLRARATDQADAERLCSEVADQIVPLLGERIYSDDGAPLELAVGRRLLARGETVAVAESCTGGLLGGRFTDAAGSSAWFRGGYIVYTVPLKEALIGGPLPDTAVSEATAQALAAAARDRAGATWGLSVTGFAGPDGDDVGSVWIGIAGPNEVFAKQLKWIGDRSRIRALAATTALNLLRLQLL
ncbi:MAG: competence/damage-inducible protein A [Acidobacteria bacterium]|nr:competence/damage-inducible protein A [Acidobacteriota bacterium]